MLDIKEWMGEKGETLAELLVSNIREGGEDELAFQLTFPSGTWA